MPDEVIRLWDGVAPPTTIEGVPPESAWDPPAGISKGRPFLRNISDATLSVHPPDGAANGVGVIVVPGGGWTINAYTHEGTEVVSWLTKAGYTCFLLKYRVQASEADPAAFEARQAAVDGGLAIPRPVAQRPRAIADLIATEEYLAARAVAADDGRRAISIVREQAARFGVRADAIGMIGFSAGAFLAVDVAL